MSNTLTAAIAREMFTYDPASGFVFFAKDGRNSRAGERAGSLHRVLGYRTVWALGRNHLEHRVAWLLAHGEWPALIDHRNGKRDDNRLVNLRLATQRVNNENLRSARSNNKVGLLGVSLCKTSGRWRAQITANNQKLKLGRFDTPEEAHEAYLAAKRALHEGCTL